RLVYDICYEVNTGSYTEFDESNTHVLERLYTSAGNPVKEILLKLNLPDHGSILTDSKMEVKIVFNDLDLLEYSSFISPACRRTHCNHTVEDDLEVFSTDDLGLDWISAHNFLTCLQKLSSYASGHLKNLLKDLLSHLGYTVGGDDIINIVSLRKHLILVGSLNYEGDHVLVGCDKDFKTLLSIHTKFQTHNGINTWFSSLKQWNAQFEIPNRVVWIDVEGTPLQAWSHAPFNRIASKWDELVYMDDSKASNKYSMRLCIKTRVHHLIAESFKVILERKVSDVRTKELTRWVPDYGEDGIAQSVVVTTSLLVFTVGKKQVTMR
ncbi:hypothetical protein Tco_0408375, partial [Tanacetum coccineum]